MRSDSSIRGLSIENVRLKNEENAKLTSLIRKIKHNWLLFNMISFFRSHICWCKN